MNPSRRTAYTKPATQCSVQVIVMLLSWMPLLVNAAEIYLNGTNITGQKNVDLGQAQVQIDAVGDIRIHAPAYEVKELEVKPTTSTTKPINQNDPTKSAPKPVELSKEYFVVSEISQPGVTGYDVQLIINNRFIQDLSDRIPQHVVELNRHLSQGHNTISFRAQRHGRQAKTNNSLDTYTLIVGIGRSTGDQLNIEEILAEFKVSAAEFGEKAQSFTIDAK